MDRKLVSLIVACVLLVGSLVHADVKPAPVQPRIQIAILLDTSGSMDGLINQARSELWRIVNEFVTTKRDGVRPLFEVALYEYGNDGLSQESNYIRQIVPLSDDLDKVSKELFALTTNGGSEYCGAVITDAVNHLNWSASGDDLKLIFIAGNEPFTQGPIDYAGACKAAIARGVIVNTIHCGPESQGVEGMWKQGALLADGSFSNIDQNQAVVHVEAPQDKEIAELGVQLNTTYINYGAAAPAAAANQAAQDANAAKLSESSSVQRAVTKANAYYVNSNWDLVDALREKKIKLEEVKDADLPEAMKKMSLEERRAYVTEQQTKRQQIQEKINTLNDQRKDYVAAELKKRSEAGGEKTLDQALIESVRAQATKKHYTFDE
ncbi:MAG: VWA domain-containing protein [Planctomycetes bacterium]|nr:VWA domain-containing protein [Planctomycetota bacterium]